MSPISTRTRSARWPRPVALALLACLVAPASLAQFEADAGNGNDQDRVARDMVSVLKAYAVYKMGQFDEAFDRYLVIAESGNTQGMLNVANMYAAGEGTEQSHEKALSWYRKAAEAGDANGMFETAQAHEKGLGTEADPARARHWYEQAAESGNAEAQHALGMHLIEQADESGGLAWLRRAATEHDHPASRRYLAARQGGDDAATQPVAEGNRNAVVKALTTMTEAAAARNAAGIVAHVAADARIRVRLPNGSGWDELDREELRALWQETFDRAQNYEVSRRDTAMRRTVAGIRVISQLDEQLASGPDGQQLTIDETAIFRIDQGRAVIHDLSLDIRRAGEAS